MIIPVILAGGSGTRLWPLSRAQYPKQLLPMAEELTMLQSTLSRLSGLDGLGQPLVIANDEHRFMVAEQILQIRVAADIILEPAGRNTAPAVAVAALAAVEQNEDPVLLILPADHVIRDPEAFRRTVQVADRYAAQAGLITFGIVPRKAETGYGYIKKGAELADSGEGFQVAEFVEKPDRATAEQYLASGRYLWNSGMFMFRATAFLQEMEKHAPDILEACRRAYQGRKSDLDFIRLAPEPFAACRSDSIDYAVMEKTDRALVIPLDCGWSDVGSWSALWEISARDQDGNVTRGEVIAQESRNCYLHATHRLLATVGISDLVVVETADAVLVARQDKSQEVKVIVERLKQENYPAVSLHRRVFRPWGSYESIDAGDRFQVKRIVVKPGAALSQQKHYHRAEHWVVVKGTARITNGSNTLLLTENQSTYIPLGEMHRLENPGTIPLELIEVQSGSYLGEDDIQRFEDVYGR